MPPQNQNPIEQIAKKSFNISLVLFILSIPMALMSPLIFDAPGSGKCIYTVVTFWCSISYPVAFIISAIFYHKFTKLGKHKPALIFSLVPLLIFIIGLVAMIINGGKFTC
jgi:hypothetical protein